MVKVIDIVENNSITGVKYGLKEVAQPVVEIKRTNKANGTIGTYGKAKQKIQTVKLRSRNKTK